MTFNGEQVNISEEVKNLNTQVKICYNMYKLKTMFIPLASTTSTTSPSSSSPLPSTTPLDDDITTVKHYIYIYPKAQDQCHHQEVLLQLAGGHQM